MQRLGKLLNSDIRIKLSFSFLPFLQFYHIYTYMNSHTNTSAATTFPFDIGLLIHTLEVRPGGPGIQPLIGKMHPKEELVLYRQNNGRFSLPATLKIANFTYFQQFASDLLLSDSAALRLTTPSNGGRVRLHMPFMPRNGWYIDFNIHNVR